MSDIAIEEKMNGQNGPTFSDKNCLRNSYSMTIRA
jgi:hypothetical protein